MRTVLTLLTLLTICASAWGQAFSIFDPAMQSPPVASGAACSTYQTTNAWDDFIDGFQTATTGYESNGWVGVGTTANIYPAADSSALTSGKPDGACSQALKIVLPTDGTETYARCDLGVAIDLDVVQTDLYFCIYIESLEGNCQILSYRTSTTPSASYPVTLSSTAIRAGASAEIPVASGQWYTVKLSYDTAAAVNGSVISVWSGGSLVGSASFTRSSGDMRYLFLGGVVALDATTDYGTIWFDLVSVKTN